MLPLTDDAQSEMYDFVKQDLVGAFKSCLYQKLDPEFLELQKTHEKNYYTKYLIPNKNRKLYELFIALYLHAARCGSKNLLIDFIKGGIPAKTAGLADHKTAFMLAAENNQQQIMEYLVKEQAFNLEQRDAKGNTALFLAIINNHDSCVAKIIDYGAKMNVRNDKQQTPLDIAIANSNPKIISMLLTAGAKAENCNSAVLPVVIYSQLLVISSQQREILTMLKAKSGRQQRRQDEPEAIAKEIIDNIIGMSTGISNMIPL